MDYTKPPRAPNKINQTNRNDSKRCGARRIRHLPVETPTRSNPKRHDQRLCPEKPCAKQNAVQRSEERCRPHTARKNHGGTRVMCRRKTAFLVGVYIAGAGAAGFRQCVTLSTNA